MTAPLLGCIADDLTGATDLAGTLVREGMRVALVVGVPESTDAASPDAADAVVVALKSRSTPPAEAVADSRRALAWLAALGVPRVYIKYASTFDSTPDGNIGPVTVALRRDLGAARTVACPAFPANGRTVYQGHLFVGSTLLSDSHMRRHPLNPMTESNLPRFLSRQTGGEVGLLPHATVARGVEAIRSELAALAERGIADVIADAIDDGDLARLGVALADEPLVSGGSALAGSIAIALRDRGAFRPSPAPAAPGIGDGPAAVIAGSCSAATLAQVEAMAATAPALRIDARRAAAGDDVAPEAIDWAAGHLDRGPVLVFSSAPAADVAAVAGEAGPEAGAAIERTLGRIACGLVDRGVRRLVVAGGETSGAVIAALGVRVLEVGREIEPGVPWVVAREPLELALVLKSGNFGSPTFFERALEAIA